MSTLWPACSPPRLMSTCQAVPKAIWLAAAVVEADVRRQRIQVGDRHFHVLGVAAGQVEPEVALLHAQVVATAQAEAHVPARQAAGHPDAVALPSAAPASPAEGRDLARELPSEDVRKRDRNARGAGAVIEVHMVDAHRAHAHHRFAGPGRGLAGFLADQDFRTAEAVEPGRPSSSRSAVLVRVTSRPDVVRDAALEVLTVGLRSPWNRPSATMTLPRSTVSTGQAPTSLPSQGV